MLETVANETEQFFAEALEEANKMVDAFVETSEEIVEQIQTNFMDEVEQYFTDFIDPILEAYLGFELIIEDAAEPITHTVEPVLNHHPACVGCRHYHGQTYGGNMLVCGMHPYGWEGEQCPDWQSMWNE